MHKIKHYTTQGYSHNTLNKRVTESIKKNNISRTEARSQLATLKGYTSWKAMLNDIDPLRDIFFSLVFLDKQASQTELDIYLAANKIKDTLQNFRRFLASSWNDMYDTYIDKLEPTFNRDYVGEANDYFTNILIGKVDKENLLPDYMTLRVLGEMYMVDRFKDESKETWNYDDEISLGSDEPVKRYYRLYNLLEMVIFHHFREKDNSEKPIKKENYPTKVKKINNAIAQYCTLVKLIYISRVSKIDIDISKVTLDNLFEDDLLETKVDISIRER
jgi:hypothetical protein